MSDALEDHQEPRYPGLLVAARAVAVLRFSAIVMLEWAAVLGARIYRTIVEDGGSLMRAVGRGAASTSKRAFSTASGWFADARDRVEQQPTFLEFRSAVDRVLTEKRADWSETLLPGFVRTSPVSLDEEDDAGPLDARMCIDRLNERYRSLVADGAAQNGQAIDISSLRRAARVYARRLQADIEAGRLPPEASSFQIIWAMRLLDRALRRRAREADRVVDSWMRGANRVLEQRSGMGVGPVTPEFRELL